jgi:hypothetical protein
MLLEEHLLPMAELELLVALLARNHLRRHNLPLRHAASAAQDRIIKPLLHIMDLSTDREIKLGSTLHALKSPVLELLAVLPALIAPSGLSPLLLSKLLL